MKKQRVAAIVILLLVAAVAGKLASTQPSALASSREPAANPLSPKVPVDINLTQISDLNLSS